MASSTKSLPSKASNSSSFTLKKQSSSLQMNFSSKLSNNGKLTSNECKKHLKNNLCLYYGVRDHKLNSCPKKQTMVTLKDCGVLVTADTSKRFLEK